MLKQVTSEKASNRSLRKQRKEAALELAHLIYKVFKDEKANGKISSGQNNAQQSGN